MSPDETQTQEPTQDTAPTEGESQDETQAPTEGESQEEAQEASEAEGQEAEGQEGEEGEEAKEGEEKKDDADAGAQATRKRAGGWQRKIDRLERERALLLEQLAAQRHGPPPAAKPDKDKTPEEKAADYIDSLVEKRLNAREAEKRQQAVVADWQRRTSEVRAAHEDFDDVVASAPLAADSALGQALLTSEHGAAILYQLAKSPAELARLTALPPLDAAREVGRLEAKLSASSSTPPRKTTAAAKRPPAPPTSVNGGKAVHAEPGRPPTLRIQARLPVGAPLNRDGKPSLKDGTPCPTLLKPPAGWRRNSFATSKTPTPSRSTSTRTTRRNTAT
jgi:hypothetical protein